MLRLDQIGRLVLCNEQAYFFSFVLRSFQCRSIRVGKRQTIETLINEEALLFAKFLRNEQEKWTPRNESLREKVDEWLAS